MGSMVLYELHHLELVFLEITKTFLCLFILTTIWFTALKSLFVDVRLTASSITLLYCEISQSPESFRSRLLKPLY